VDKEGAKTDEETINGVQVSEYYDSDDSYLCLSMAKSSLLRPRKKVSVTIGIKVDAGSREKIKFLSDPSIERRTVNLTCERCPIKDCTDRVKEPTSIQRKEKRKAIQSTLDEILNQ